MSATSPKKSFFFASSSWVSALFHHPCFLYSEGVKGRKWIAGYSNTFSQYLSVFSLKSWIWGYFPTWIQQAVWQEKAQMRLGSLITLLADCGIPLLLSWSNSPKELQKGEWWINLIIAPCVVKDQLLHCPPTPLGALNFISSTQGERLFLWVFFPFRLYSKEWSTLKSLCWGFSSWSRGFKAFLTPSNPPGTKWQGWFSWWLSDSPTALMSSCRHGKSPY